jgi:hypothetical protein
LDKGTFYVLKEHEQPTVSTTLSSDGMIKLEKVKQNGEVPQTYDN